MIDDPSNMIGIQISLFFGFKLLDLTEHFFQGCFVHCGHELSSQGWIFVDDTWILFSLESNDLFVESKNDTHKGLSEFIVSEQFLPDLKGNLELDTRDSQEDSLLGHRVNTSSPVPVEIRLCFKSACMLTKFNSLEYFVSQREELVNGFYYWMPVPMNSHTLHTHIHLAIFLPIQLAMNIHMQLRDIFIIQAPSMQALMEGTLFKHFLKKVVGIQIFFTHHCSLSPATKRVFASHICEVSRKK